MTDDEWKLIVARFAQRWPDNPMRPDGLRVYRETLNDLEADAVLVALGEIADAGRETPPPPRMIRACALTGAAQTTRASSHDEQHAVENVSPDLTAPSSAPLASTPETAPPAPASSAPPPSPGPELRVVPSARGASGAGAGARTPAPSGGIAISKERPVLVAVAAAAIVFMSCFMEWISVPFGSVAGSSTGDGKIVMILAAIGVALVLISTAKRAFAIGSGLLGVACVAIAIVDMNNIESELGDSGLGEIASVGTGLYLALIASIVWTAAAAISGLEQKGTASKQGA